MRIPDFTAPVTDNRDYSVMPLSGDDWTGWYVLDDGNYLVCNQWESFEPSNDGNIIGGVYYDITYDPESVIYDVDDAILDGGIKDYDATETFADFMQWVKDMHGVNIVRRMGYAEVN